MMYGIEAGRGFLALIANPGMGKTTLLFHLLEQFRNSARSALLFQTQCSSREFMHLLMSELGYETQGFDFVRIADIGFGENGFAATAFNRLDSFIAVFFFQVDDGDFAAFFRKTFAGCAANARTPRVA